MINRIGLILLAAVLLPLLSPLPPSFAQSANQSEVRELRRMIEEMKKQNEEKIKELERIRAQDAHKIQSLENRVNELTQEQDAPQPPSYILDRQQREEYVKEIEEQEERDFIERLNAGDKPYKDLFDKSPWKLTWGGYADLLVSWFDHGPDQTRPGGSESDSRLEFDLARFVLELEGEMFAGLGFEAEIEFEHGGTGSALELEFEEFGEFELEAEKGGEVIIEELYLRKKFGDWGKLKAGRFYLAFGLMSYLNKPTNYLAARRPEAELAIIPAVWDEIGLSFDYYVNENWDLTFQVVNGLDSSGFSSLYWVREGQQKKFEFIQADGLAFVGRVDYKVPDWGLLVGTSAYYGLNTNANRPEDDLDGVDSPLLILDAHAIFRHEKWRASGVAMWGHLWNADEISERNTRLPNSLQAPRTPVSDQAVAMWGEVGYNINNLVGLDYLHRLEPFVRFDYYDSVYKPRSDLFDNPRFERNVFTGGVSYTFAKSVFIKLDYGYRYIPSPDFRNESTVNLSWGFVY